jgi:VCBS repeat-containing protein
VDAHGGPVNITITISDATTAVQTSFQVSLAAVNDRPVARADSYATSNGETLAVTGAGMLANDTDVDAGDSVLVAAINGDAAAPGTAITLASGARLTVNADGSFTYDPTGAFAALGAGEQATDTFDYEIVDSHGGSSIGSVVINVSGAEVAPPRRAAAAADAAVRSGSDRGCRAGLFLESGGGHRTRRRAGERAAPTGYRHGYGSGG